METDANEIRKYGVTRASQVAVFLAMLIGGIQLPIIALISFDLVTAGTGNITRTLLEFGENYFVFVISQLELFVIYVLGVWFVQIKEVGKELPIKRIFILLVCYGIAGGFLLYVRAVGGLGGLYSFE